MSNPFEQIVARIAAGAASLVIGLSALGLSAKAEPPQVAAGAAYKALHVFEGGVDGAWPTGRLAGDPSVALFGTTTDGGRGEDKGTVYRLTRRGTDVWKHEVIFSAFNEKNGYDPQQLVEVGGSLVGVTHYGGQFGAGTIFELRKRSQTSKRWDLTVLHHFNVDDGAETQTLVQDKANGVVYGATSRGGDLSCGFGDGCGVIYALRRDAKNESWSYEVIHRFSGGADGWRPWGPALAFSGGALYGSTHFGGVDCVDDSPYNFDCGTVYRLDPPAKAKAPWTKTILYSFQGDDDGARPQSTLVVRDGSVFGTTIMAGAERRGTVFKVTEKQGPSDFSVIHTFAKNQSYIAGLTAGPDGALFATGEKKACANVFSLTPAPASGTYTLAVLKKFKEDVHGCYPEGRLRYAPSENAIYGMSWDGGANGAGAVYRLRLKEPATQ